MSGKRLNIGFLINEYRDIFAREVCIGAMEAAEEMDANLYIMAGGYLDAPYMEMDLGKYSFQNNFLFRYADKENVDVLVVLLGTIASNVDEMTRRRFLEAYTDIPIITIAGKVEGYSSISFMNKKGFAREIEYLIKALGRKKIGIVCGPPTNEDSLERLEAYKEVLTKYNMPIEDTYIVYGNYTEYSDEVVEKLLDQNPDLDAIAFSNDHMAIGGYRVLEKRGLKVGEDIAVVGFDDAPFAALMEPGLATTRANPAKMGYRAIVEACRLKPGEEKDIRVETNFVIRESCGEKIKNISQRISENISFTKGQDELFVLAAQIVDILFDGEKEDYIVSRIEKVIGEFSEWFFPRVYEKSIDDQLREQIGKKLFELDAKLYEKTHDVNLLHVLNTYMLQIVMDSLPSDEDRVRLQRALAECYRDMLVLNEKNRDMYSRDQERLARVATSITRDIINEENDVEYQNLLSNMHLLDVSRSYVVLFPSVIECEKSDSWQRIDNMTVKVYQNGRGSQNPDAGQEKLNIANLFTPPFYPNDQRQTYALQFLFAEEEQYGIFVMEPSGSNLAHVESLTYQMASAIQAIRLLQNRKEMSIKLEESLQQLKETNVYLDEVSKSDELTRIYNRRGFLVTAKRVMKFQKNLNKSAFVIYADMDNLKLINDQFGHEEGDYALKAIANILKKSLGEKPIVGRLGGDEFVAFLFAGDGDKEQDIRERITEETKRLNDSNDKPYYVSMSIGICSFTNKEDARLDDVMAKADADLYIQKKYKRNKIFK